MKKGEIWTINLPSPEGHEQSGTRPALVFQVRAIDKKRLREKLGDIEENKQKDIDAFLKILMTL